MFQSVEESFGGYELGEATSPVNRRGSQGPEPEPPPDESNLKRAVSCESVCSDTSVNLGDLEDVTIVGHVCVGLEHERWGGRGADCEGDLAVSVLEARDLVAPDGRPAQDTLARFTTTLISAVLKRYGRTSINYQNVVDLFIYLFL